MNFTLIQLVELKQAVDWRDKVLLLERSTMSITLEHQIEVELETEYAQ